MYKHALPNIRPLCLWLTETLSKQSVLVGWGWTKQLFQNESLFYRTKTTLHNLIKPLLQNQLLLYISSLLLRTTNNSTITKRTIYISSRTLYNMGKHSQNKYCNQILLLANKNLGQQIYQPVGFAYTPNFKVYASMSNLELASVLAVTILVIKTQLQKPSLFQEHVL